MYNTEFGRRLRTQSSGTSTNLSASSPSSSSSTHPRSDPYSYASSSSSLAGPSAERLISTASASGLGGNHITASSSSDSSVNGVVGSSNNHLYSSSPRNSISGIHSNHNSPSSSSSIKNGRMSPLKNERNRRRSGSFNGTGNARTGTNGNGSGVGGTDPIRNNGVGYSLSNSNNNNETSSSRSSMDSPRTPGRNKKSIGGDRFIPSRDGADISAQYQLMEDPPTPGRQKRKATKSDMDAQKEEANHSFTNLLSSELFGGDSGGSPIRAGSNSSNSHVHTSGGSSASRISHSSISGGGGGGGGSVSTPTTPSKNRNLLNYHNKSPSHSRSGGSKVNERIGIFGEFDSSPSNHSSGSGTVRGAGAGIGSGTGIFSGIIGDGLDSPNHQAYNASPIRPESKEFLSIPRKPARILNKVPYKVLDAPELADDFYLNLVDWSSSNILSVGLGKSVYLWSAKTAAVTKLCDYASQEDSVTGLSWSGRGNHIAVGTEKGLVQIWDTEQNKLIRTMSGHSGRVGSLAWNEHILTSGSRDRSIYHRDVRVPEHHVRQLTAHRQEVCGLKWNTETNQLASGGNDNKLIIWDGLLENPLHRFSQHQAAVKAIGWSPHEQGILASGGGTADMKIRFWNTKTGNLLNEIDTFSQVCNISWSKTSNELISTHGFSSGKIQNQIQIWKYPTMKPIATLSGHTMRVLYLSMSPNGETIVTGAGDETLRFWDLNDSNGLNRNISTKRLDGLQNNPFARLR